MQITPSSMVCRPSLLPAATQKLRDVREALSAHEFDEMYVVAADAWLTLGQQGFKRSSAHPRSLSLESEFWGIVIVLASAAKPAQFHLTSVKHQISNFVAAPVAVSVKRSDKIYEIIVPCTEAGFQMAKADLSKDDAAFRKIYYSDTPNTCKQEGSKVIGLDRAAWDSVSSDVMTQLFQLKIEQSPELRDFIIAARSLAEHFCVQFPDRFFVHESAHFDDKWGTALDTPSTVKVIMDSTDINNYPAIKPYAGENKFGACFNSALKSSDLAPSLSGISKKAKLSPPEDDESIPLEPTAPVDTEEHMTDPDTPEPAPEPAAVEMGPYKSEVADVDPEGATEPTRTNSVRKAVSPAGRSGSGMERF